MSTPFDDEVLRDWLLAKFEAPAEWPTEMVTVGSGPFEEGEFDECLRALDCALCPVGEDVGVLVVGRSDWEEADINAAIDARRGQKLRVYSQEMIVAYFSGGVDPYDDEKALERFAEDHPVFDYLRNCWVEWPKTSVPVEGLGGHAADPEWIPMGPLKLLGYAVGRNGKPTSVRRRILEEAFTTASLPRAGDAQYMASWGTASSSARLQKMADSIATFARNAKKRRKPPEEAIAQWEEDLQWLKARFYKGRFRFTWPDSKVS